MGEASAPPTGPDLTQGRESSQIPEDGSLLGHAHGEAVTARCSWRPEPTR